MLEGIKVLGTNWDISPRKQVKQIPLIQRDAKGTTTFSSTHSFVMLSPLIFLPFGYPQLFTEIVSFFISVPPLVFPETVLIAISYMELVMPGLVVGPIQVIQLPPFWENEPPG